MTGGGPMKTKKTAVRSADYVVKVMFLALLPVVILDVVVSIYIMDALRKQTVQTLMDTASLYISQIDTAHISINKHLIRCLDQENLRNALETEDAKELILSYNDLSKEVTVFMESFDLSYQFFFYNSQNERFLRPNGVYPSMTQNELRQLNNELTALMQDIDTDVQRSYSDAWEILSAGDTVYFVKIFHSGSCYAGCCISADHIIEPLKEINLGNHGFVSLTDKDGVPLTNEKELKKLNIEFSPAGSGPNVYTSGWKLVLNGGLTMGAFCPHIILDKMTVYERILALQLLITATVLLIAIGLFGSILYMKRQVLNPIKTFSENLSRYRDMEIIDLEDSNLIELEQANLQFQNLMDQIRRLKIDIYEQELEKQRIQMNYMQLQIRPHFFLNCLNTIYSMAQTQLYEEIMQLSVIISDYFRYIFKNTQDFVPVYAELRHIENYMKIQKLRYGERLSYEIYAEEGTKNVKILPILLQTFIENAIKYSAVLDEKMHIRTDISWAQADAYARKNIQIQITDNGTGFPQEVLEALNDDRLLEPAEGHRIGITNAIQRLRLFYKKGEAAAAFSNLSAGGACVTILLPADESHMILQEDEGHACTSCR